MNIGWYPGHMVTARRKAAETMARIDVVVEVLDARVPGASRNPMINELRLHRQRPCLRLLNKADVADPVVTAAWVRAFETETSPQAAVKAVALSCKKPADVAKVTRLAAALAPHRGTPLKPLRLMVMGIPNVGKSTLINALLRRRSANVGDEPAVTKGQTRYVLDDRTELIDTPGLMWPAIRHASDGLMLAASHAIGVNAYVDEEVATFLATLLLERYPELLRARYGLDPARCDGRGVIEAIAKKRGYLLKGGVPDDQKAALALLHDYRVGALGRVSLETPQSRSEVIARDQAAAASTASAEALPGE